MLKTIRANALFLNMETKSFEQLCNEKASCLEYALNGYIRIYEEGEKRCECDSCKSYLDFPL